MSEGGGYITLSRKFFTGWAWRLTPNQMMVFLWLLNLAAWKDGKVLDGGKLIPVKRGECFFFRSDVAEACRVSRRVVSRTIEILVATGTLMEHKRNTRRQHITFCKYDSYQHTPREVEHNTHTTRALDAHSTRTRRALDGHIRRNSENSENTRNSDAHAHAREAEATPEPVLDFPVSKPEPEPTSSKRRPQAATLRRRAPIADCLGRLDPSTQPSPHEAGVRSRAARDKREAIRGEMIRRLADWNGVTLGDAARLVDRRNASDTVLGSLDRLEEQVEREMA